MITLEEWEQVEVFDQRMLCVTRNAETVWALENKGITAKMNNIVGAAGMLPTKENT